MIDSLIVGCLTILLQAESDAVLRPVQFVLVVCCRPTQTV